jgi:predicted dienelactone hydrolase
VVWYPARGAGGEDAPVRRGRHPVIVFSHGSCGLPTESTYYTTALASRGFVVVAPTHPGNTADDGLATCIGMFVDSALNRFPDVQTTIDAILAAASDSSSRGARRFRTDGVEITAEPKR